MTGLKPWLTSAQRSKLDGSDDALFYEQPRFVTHVDDAFLKRLTQLYRDRLKSGSRVLDLMSSWVSHLPEDMQFETVVGHGLNAQELARNPRFDRWFVQNLNQQPSIPEPDASFDAVLIAVSIQYLQYPERVLAEVRRVLRPGGQLIISFSNRLFYSKAIAAWRDGSEAQRLALVQDYIRQTAGFSKPEVIAEVNSPLGWQQWLGLGQDPFYAVLATAV
ncbi:class I SAM-dependent methyltransferase [Synechococcus elongatus]|uniref:Class I SAM-dependent methyltransferase n=1 Tax=Synechococcus elongatus PCC 11802 TaxID=2283154 RepID=A0AAT9K7V4_SYNEL|nr:class I SAM-dependent methyltransferase [Synechococcus elongatus]QFZ92995.1 class I SAM-dependent methyltransferase [Synechococcus elongatus PCC 11802]